MCNKTQSFRSLYRLSNTSRSNTSLVLLAFTVEMANRLVIALDFGTTYRYVIRFWHVQALRVSVALPTQMLSTIKLMQRFNYSPNGQGNLGMTLIKHHHEYATSSHLMEASAGAMRSNLMRAEIFIL